MATVLVVDDDRDIRTSLRFALEMEGCTVLEAANGRAALDILRLSATPLVVLLDLRMPEMDGAAVLRHVEADPDLASFHAFILVTANHRLESRMLSDVLRRMHVPVLHKPFDLDDLLDAVWRMRTRLHHVEPGSQPSADACG